MKKAGTFVCAIALAFIGRDPTDAVHLGDALLAHRMTRAVLGAVGGRLGPGPGHLRDQQLVLLPAGQGGPNRPGHTAHHAHRRGGRAPVLQPRQLCVDRPGHRCRRVRWFANEPMIMIIDPIEVGVLPGDRSPVVDAEWRG